MVADETYKRNKRGAFNKLAFLHRHQGDSALVPVVSVLQKKAEELLIARSMLDRGDPEGAIASRLGMHPFAVGKNILPVARLHTPQQITGYMELLCDLEGKVKGAARSKRSCVEHAVYCICRG
jgi:DNA polymerase III delta subunit